MKRKEDRGEKNTLKRVRRIQLPGLYPPIISSSTDEPAVVVESSTLLKI